MKSSNQSRFAPQYSRKAFVIRQKEPASFLRKPQTLKQVHNRNVNQLAWLIALGLSVAVSAQTPQPFPRPNTQKPAQPPPTTPSAPPPTAAPPPAKPAAPAATTVTP